MNLGKISFLKRMYLAITDFRMYPYTQKEKVSTAIGYFFKLIIFVSIIIGAFATSNIYEESPMILEMFKENVPEFTISGGKLEATENLQKELNSDTYLIVNSDFNYNQMKEIIIEEETSHNYYVLVLSDATVIGTRLEEGIYELGGIQYEAGVNLTKQQIINEWEILNESTTSKLYIWIGVSIGVFIVMLIIRAWTLIMYLISAYIINFMFGLRLKFKDYVKVVIYASTLPLILETVALIMVGTISETVNFISVLVSSVYIFYALRAIKLDSLILGGSGKTAEEKIKNALAHAQEELEKQLKELEDKEQKENEAEKEKID